MQKIILSKSFLPDTEQSRPELLLVELLARCTGREVVLLCRYYQDASFSTAADELAQQILPRLQVL